MRAVRIGRLLKLSDREVGVMAKIKPCPFCGLPAQPKLIGGAWKVICEGELCASKSKYFSKDMAIKEWNQRTRPQKMESEEQG